MCWQHGIWVETRNILVWLGVGVGAVTHAVPSLVFYSKQLLCDVMIVAEDVEIEAHRVVLAACSPYFCAMFTGTMRGKK